MQTPENRRREAICRSRPVSGNRSEVWRHTWTGQRWSFTTCKSQSINTWERSSTFCRRSWEITENSPIFGIETTKTNVSTWGFFISSTVEAAIHLGPRYTDNLEVYKNTNLEGNSEFIRYHSEVDIGSFWWNSECETNWKYSSIMDETYIASWSSDQVDKSKSTCLLRLRSVSGGLVRPFRSKSKMGKSSYNNFNSHILTENYLELMENRLSSSGIYFPGLASLGILQKIQNDLHVNVQRHRMDKNRKRRELSLKFRKRSRRTRRDSRRDIGRSSALETKRNGMEIAKNILEGKWDSIASQMVQRFKETSHPVFTSASALSRGILGK